MERVDAKEPTHLEDGNIECWYCAYCQKYYKGAAGANELSLEEIIIPKLKDHTADGTGWHSDETNHWNTCACGEKLNEAAHTFAWITDKEATATENGSKHEECSVCGAVRNAGTIIPATLGHCWIIDFIISVKDFVIGATKGTVEFIISAFKQIIGK